MSLELFSQLERNVSAALEQTIAEARERCIRQALAAYETDLRSSIGRVGIDVARYFTIERMGQQITIAIKDSRAYPEAMK